MCSLYLRPTAHYLLVTTHDFLLEYYYCGTSTCSLAQRRGRAASSSGSSGRSSASAASPAAT
eukprot:scaffold52964_cov61-Phaeocystis_antarctica.AAC.1